MAWTARADFIAPKEGVSSATVRALPAGDADPHGTLASGETAVFVGQVPRWFEVILSDGKPGLVS